MALKSINKELYLDGLQVVLRNLYNGLSQTRLPEGRENIKTQIRIFRKRFEVIKRQLKNGS